MYTAYCDGKLFFELNNIDATATQCVIDTAVNEAASCTITLPPTNEMVNAPVVRRSVISIYEGDEEIFRGSVHNSSFDFDQNRTFEVDGALAWLQEVRKPPFQIVSALTVSSYLNALITQYNAAVPTAKQIKMGNCTVTGTITRERNSEYETMFDLIKDMVSNKGGYISIRYADGDIFLDYFDEYDTTTVGQMVEFGRNLLDLEKETDSDTLVTRVWPIGKERLGIADVNDGVNYLVNRDAELFFGRIDGTVNVDSDDATTVKTYGQAYLTRYSKLKTSITVTALDLSVVDRKQKRLEIGDNVNVFSPPHNLDLTMQVVAKSIDLVAPEKSTVTLGAKVNTLTRKMRQAQ